MYKKEDDELKESLKQGKIDKNIFKIKMKQLKKERKESKKTQNKNSIKKKNPSERAIPGLFESDLDASLLLSFLFYDYRDEKYYWTSVIMLWKTIIALMIVFIPPNYLYLSLYAFYIILLGIYSYFSPYNHHSTSKLITISLFCNMGSLDLGEYIHDATKYQNEVVAINLLMHLMFLVLAGYLFITNYEYNELAEKMAVALVRKEDNKHVKSLIIRLQRFETFKVAIEQEKQKQKDLERENEGPRMMFTETKIEFPEIKSEDKQSVEIPQEVDQNLPTDSRLI